MRRKVRAKRGLENRTNLTISSRVEQAFESWSQILLTTPAESKKRLSRFLHLRQLVTEESAVTTLIDLGYSQIIVDSIKNSENKDLQASYLYAMSDLVDVDQSGTLGKHFIDMGVIPDIISILRVTDSAITAGLCALSSLSHHDMERTTKEMDYREIILLDTILQVKSMMHLHSRVLTFINNIYVWSKFQSSILQYIVPSLMTLLMYNVTNHIKSRKWEQESSSPDDGNDYPNDDDPPKPSRPRKLLSYHDGPTFPSLHTSVAAAYENYNKREGKGQGNEPTDDVAQLVSFRDDSSDLSQEENSDYEIDSMYDDGLYIDFIESACYLLGNLTTSDEVCELTEQYSFIDIMTLLFHNTDTPLETLTSVIKCLGNLGRKTVHQEKLIDSNILPITFKLIKLNIDNEMKAQISLLLANMASYEGYTNVLIKAGVIEPIIDLFHSKDSHHHYFAALAIANIATNATAIPALMNTQLLKYLLRLAHNSLSNVRRQVMRILNSIAAYPSGAYWAALIQAGAVQVLRYVVANEPASALNEQNGKVSSCALANSALGYIEENFIETVLPRGIQMFHPLYDPISIAAVEEGRKAVEAIQTDMALSLIEKTKGNDSFIQKSYTRSIVHYTRSLQYDPTNYAVFSNRAAAYMHLNQWELALRDSEECARLAPDFVKGYFRKGKALHGLGQYGEAVKALSYAFNLKRDNKEIKEALQKATLRQNDNTPSPIPSAIQKLTGRETVDRLTINNQASPDSAGLANHLYNLFKRYYDPELDFVSRMMLMGWLDVTVLSVKLHTWANIVHLNKLMDTPGIPDLIFAEPMIIPRMINQPEDKVNAFLQKPILDYSCHHFSFFVCTILARLVLQGNPKYGHKALKHLIALNSNKLVRKCCGSPLSFATLHVSGFGGFGLPKLPSLRSLFILYGGLTCVALDCMEDPSIGHFCASILGDITAAEWQKQTPEIIKTVISSFILIYLHKPEFEKVAAHTFGNIYAAPLLRNHHFYDWAQNRDQLGNFCHFVSSQTQALFRGSHLHSKEPKRELIPVNAWLLQELSDVAANDPKLNPPNYLLIGEMIAQVWVSTQSDRESN